MRSFGSHHRSAGRGRKRRRDSFALERLEARLALDAAGLFEEFHVCGCGCSCGHSHNHGDEFQVASVRHANGLLSLSPDDRIIAPGGSLNTLGPLDDQSFTLTNTAAGLPQLNSKPGAPTAIYLDFDGHDGNGAFDRDGDPTTFNAAEAATITEAHRQTSVFFAMFDVNVTTVRPTVPFAWLVISNDIEGGFSSVNVFPNDRPRSWINSSSAESRITGLVHEIGHNFGLLHQSDYDEDGNLTSEYSNGLGSLHGALMGVDYRRDVQKWFIGHHNRSPSELQDDVAVIANVIKRYQPTGGDGFRADDHGGTFATATTLTVVDGGRSASGNIERMTDVDTFSFTTSGAGAVISVVPTRPSGLDAKLEVFDANGALLAASDTAANEQQLVVPAGTGTWYVSVSSHGDYGDLGLYDLTVNDLPEGWTTADVGDIKRLPGDATFAAGEFTVAGAGARVGSTSDAFRFVWQTLSGDGSIVARVTQNEATNPQAKAGVMIRESLAANSKHVAMVTTASQGPQLISRGTNGANSTIVGGTAGAFAPTWVRLVRTGNVITASRSADGVSWVTVGSVTVAMSTTVRIGLLTTAQDATKINTARFTDVSLSGTLNPPEAVNGLAAPADVSVRQGGGASLVVNWQPVTGATGYRIERSENGADFSSVFDAEPTATSWTDIGLPGALRYFYRVRALSASGRSAASTVVSEINRPSPVTKASIAPMPNSNTQLILNWRDTSGESGYRIERSTDNATFTQIATVAANVPSYTAGGLTAGTQYWFRISPMTATGDGNPVVVTRGTSGTQAVTELAFTSKSSSAIGIEWTAVASATNYRIERSQNGTSFTTLATVASGTLAYTDTPVNVLGKYYYRVVAINGSTVATPSPTIFTAAPRTEPLPAPWTAADIGSVAGEGATGLQSGKFILVSSGTDIGGPADSFRFTSQPLVGDGSIVTRVTLQETTGDWAKAGVMIRESTAVDARQAVMVVSPTKGIAWQYRHNVGGAGVVAAGPADQTAPVWLKLERVGNRFTGSWSTDGVAWTEAGSTTVAMGPTAVIGLVSTSDVANRLNRAEFTDVAVSSQAPAVVVTETLSAMSTPLGEASAAQTIAVTGLALTAPVVATAPAGFEVAADGVTFGPTAQFAPAGGVVSGTLSVRLAASAPAGLQAGSVILTSDGAAPVAVAIPESTVLQAVTELAFTSKASSAIGIEWTAAAAATDYRIERSQNGTAFTTLATVDADTLAYTDATVAVLGKYYYRVVAIYGSTAADPSPTIFTAAPRTTPLPAPWTAADIGSVAGEGATGLQSDTFILVSSGTAIGGPADSFRFTSQPLVGDGSIIVRVTSLEDTGGWAKAGVMIRESAAVDARQAVLVVSPTNGIAWQYRHDVGENGVTTVVAADQAAPGWLKLTRAGNRFTGSWSTDGVTWTEAGSTTVSMGPTAVIGLVSTSDDANLLNRSEFTDVSVSMTGGQPVTVTGVYVRGTAWTAGYLGRTPFTTLDGAALGWQLPDGSAQLTAASTVGWSNVNVISVRFDQPIAQPAADALQLILGTAGGSQTIVPTAAPVLLAGGTVAQWTLPASLATGRYVISLAAAGITNAAGTATLDGEWTTSSSAFATGSGDGSEGGTFNFFFNVLVGNVNGDATTNAGDISAIRTKLISPLSTPLPADADFRLDVDGSNTLTATDSSQVRRELTGPLGTPLSSLPQVTAPAELSARSFAALSQEEEGTLATGLSADAWAWYALTAELEAAK